MVALQQDRSHESVLNTTLAGIFRDRSGLDAVEETLQASGKRPDIIETELAPSATVVYLGTGVLHPTWRASDRDAHPRRAGSQGYGRCSEKITGRDNADAH